MERFHGNGLTNLDSAVIWKITPEEEIPGWTVALGVFPENFSSIGPDIDF